jgi:hypothetical protein
MRGKILRGNPYMACGFWQIERFRRDDDESPKSKKAGKMPAVFEIASPGSMPGQS